MWIYSGGDEQEIVALTRHVKLPEQDGTGTWYVELKPDLAVTKYLEAHALPRSLFRQVPTRQADRVTESC